MSERDLEVLRYLSSRLTYAEISGHLYLSVNTVKSHVTSIRRKLDASTRAEAIERAGLVGML